MLKRLFVTIVTLFIILIGVKAEKLTIDISKFVPKVKLNTVIESSSALRSVIKNIDNNQLFDNQNEKRTAELVFCDGIKDVKQEATTTEKDNYKVILENCKNKVCLLSSYLNKIENTDIGTDEVNNIKIGNQTLADCVLYAYNVNRLCDGLNPFVPARVMKPNLDLNLVKAYYQREKRKQGDEVNYFDSVIYNTSDFQLPSSTSTIIIDNLTTQSYPAKLQLYSLKEGKTQSDAISNATNIEYKGCMIKQCSKISSNIILNSYITAASKQNGNYLFNFATTDKSNFSIEEYGIKCDGNDEPSDTIMYKIDDSKYLNDIKLNFDSQTDAAVINIARQVFENVQKESHFFECELLYMSTKEAVTYDANETYVVMNLMAIKKPGRVRLLI